MPPSQQQTCDNQLFSNRTAVFSWNPLFGHQTSLPIYPLRCALIAVAQFEWIMIRKKSVATPSCKISSNIDFLQHLIGMHFLQEHSPFGWSFARGWSLRMIICIRCYLLFVVDHCLSFVIVCLKIRDFCRPLPMSLQMLGINSNTKHLELRQLSKNARLYV